MNALDEKSFKVEFTEKDREFMNAYFRLAEMVADLVGPHCEVVLHSFENLEHSVVKIVNGHHTGRIVGSPITDMGLKMLKLFQQTGEVNSKSYFTRNKQGEMLKSSTCVLAGEHGKPIGMFCVNMNLSAPFPEIIQTLVPDFSNSLFKHENFSSNVNDVILQALEGTKREVEADPKVSQKLKNKTIVFQLNENGIFEFKDATIIVAEHLKITKYAIYKFLREFRALAESNEDKT